jgi:hypothetical protein
MLELFNLAELIPQFHVSVAETTLNILKGTTYDASHNL